MRLSGNCHVVPREQPHVSALKSLILASSRWIFKPGRLPHSPSFSQLRRDKHDSAPGIFYAGFRVRHTFLHFDVVSEKCVPTFWTTELRYSPPCPTSQLDSSLPTSSTSRSSSPISPSITMTVTEKRRYTYNLRPSFDS